MPNPLRMLVASLGVWHAAMSYGGAASERFTGVWADGTRSVADEVLNWQTDRAQPSLAGRALFDPANPLRWLRDNSIAAAATPEAYVEMSGGDRLPGRVVGYRRGGGSSADNLPPHLMIEPAASVGEPARASLRVIVEQVRRIVCKRHGNGRFRPGTLFHQDGREIKFRSLRWGEGVVRLLVDEGPAEVPLSQIAELHLPASDPWDDYLRQLAVLCPSGTGRLMRLETGDGLVATTSLERFQARSAAAATSSDPNHWLHVVQPAWSLDPLYVKHRAIRLRQFFAAHELPLTWIEPVHSRQRPSLAPWRAARVDRSVEGGRLSAGGADYAWGFGVQAEHELEFSLAAYVRGFSTRAGLDHVVGRGGCARARVLLAPLASSQAASVAEPAARRLLCESPVLVGSQQVYDSGVVPIAGPGRLVLVADPVERDRPAGADPLDIRDLFDWLEPRLLLDPATLAVEIRRHLPWQVPAWQGWQARLDDPATSWSNRWQGDDERGCGFRLCVRPGPTASLVRRLPIAPGRECLLLAVERGPEASPSQIEVRLDGRAAGRFDVPLRTHPAAAPDPLVVYLHAERGREAAIELLPVAGDERSWIDWRGLGLAPRPPQLYRWFEDEPQFLAALAHGEGQARLARDDKFAGAASLRLTRGERANAHYPGLRLPIRYQPQPGEYRYLRFAWRKRGGGRIGVQLAHDGRFGPDPRPPDAPPLVEMPEGRSSFRYDAGVGSPTLGSALRVYDQPLANQWQVVTRDLYADFGGFELTGISLVVPDGDEALFDHVYLARSLGDFQWIERERASERVAERLARLRRFLPGEANDPLLAREMVEAFAPGFTLDESCLAGVTLFDEHLGRRGVLRTTATGGDKPCRWSGMVDVPWARTTRLLVSVAKVAGHEGRLVVKANGQVLASAPVAPATANDAWSDLVADLTSFAGQKFGVALAIERFGQPDHPSTAYFSRLEVLSD